MDDEHYKDRDIEKIFSSVKRNYAIALLYLVIEFGILIFLSISIFANFI